MHSLLTVIQMTIQRLTPIKQARLFRFLNELKKYLLGCLYGDTKMHEKSCLNSHNARKCQNRSTIQSFTHLTMMKLRKYPSHEFL